MMDENVTLSIPARWIKDLTTDPDELREALMLGLAQLRRQQSIQDVNAKIVQVLLSTGRVRRLSTKLWEDETPSAGRQTPPRLPGPPVSEILVAQRRGEP